MLKLKLKGRLKSDVLKLMKQVSKPIWIQMAWGTGNTRDCKSLVKPINSSLTVEIRRVYASDWSTSMTMEVGQEFLKCILLLDD